MTLPTSDVRVFIDERPVSVRAPSCVRDAVAAYDPEAASAAERGTAYVTDGVGRRVALDAPLESGAILRVVRSAPRDEDGDVGEAV